MKVQDGNGSSMDLDEPVGPESKKPQKKTQKSKATDAETDPKSHNNNRDALLEFFNTDEFPVDMNAADAEMLFKAYMAKMGAGLRT